MLPKLISTQVVMPQTPREGFDLALEADDSTYVLAQIFQVLLDTDDECHVGNYVRAVVDGLKE